MYMIEFLLIGIVIIIGFVGNLLSKRIKLSEALYLILIGILIGPVFNLLDPIFFKEISPFVVTLTLIIILLQSGLNFNIRKIFKSFYKATIFTFLVLIFTTLFVSILMIYVFNWEPLYAILLGIVSSGTTTITVVQLLDGTKLNEEIKHMLVLESILNDVILVVGALIVIEIITLGTINIQLSMKQLASNIFTGLFTGFISAVIFLYILEKFLSKNKLNYVITIGTAFLIYSLTEIIGGNGAISVLVYSLVIGNSNILLKMIKIKTKKLFQRVKIDIERIGDEISFFIKTFFFVFLGLVFDLESLTSNVLIICFSLVILLILSRYISSFILGQIDKKYIENWFIISTMIPRGFVATLIAFLSSEAGLIIPNFTNVILLMIFFGTFTSIIGNFIYRKKYKTL